MGKPVGDLMDELTAPDMAWYEAADKCGLIPDNSVNLQLACLAAGVDPSALIGTRSGPVDFSALYQQRKAMYGGKHRNIRADR